MGIVADKIQANKEALSRMKLQKGDKVLLRRMSFNQQRIPEFLHNQWVTVYGITTHFTPYTYTWCGQLEITSTIRRRKPFHYDDIVALARNGSRISLL